MSKGFIPSYCLSILFNRRQLSEIKGLHDKGTVFKGRGFIKGAVLDEFIEIVLNHDKRELWDKNSEFYYPITSLDENTDICHVGVKGYGFFELDFIEITKWPNQDGSVLYPLETSLPFEELFWIKKTVSILQPRFQLTSIWIRSLQRSLFEVAFSLPLGPLFKKKKDVGRFSFRVSV